MSTDGNDPIFDERLAAELAQCLDQLVLRSFEEHVDIWKQSIEEEQRLCRRCEDTPTRQLVSLRFAEVRVTMAMGLDWDSKYIIPLVEIAIALPQVTSGVDIHVNFATYALRRNSTAIARYFLERYILLDERPRDQARADRLTEARRMLDSLGS